MNKCRKRECFEWCVLSPENANDVLEKLGFGKEYCNKTYDKDKRYGYYNDNGIHYGFENHMACDIKYGKYIVFDYMDREILSKEEFDEYYESI